jgi:hypothetical protein
MDVVYILGTGSLWGNNEIRYSLRSIEKFFDFEKVFVVGEYPQWMKGAIHIPAKDETQIKQENALRKLLVACNDTRISEKFVLMNDDFFFLEKRENIPYYSRGSIDEVIKKHPIGSGCYFQSLVDTRNALKNTGKRKIIDYGVHSPFVCEKKKLVTAMEFAQKKGAHSLRTVYGNLFFIQAEKINTASRDFKVRGEQFDEKLVKDWSFLSSDDSLVLSKDFRTFLQKKFPKVSQFENDGGEGISATPGVPLDGIAVEFITSSNDGYARGDRAIFRGTEREKALRYIKEGICRHR